MFKEYFTKTPSIFEKRLNAHAINEKDAMASRCLDRKEVANAHYDQPCQYLHRMSFSGVRQDRLQQLV